MKKNKIQFESTEARVLRQSWDECKGLFINPATRFFEEGEEVRIGGIDKVIVLEAFNDKKVYKVKEFHELRRDRGEQEVIRYVPWHCLKSKKIIHSEERFSEEDPFRMCYINTTIDSLRHLYYFWGIDDSVDYQRGNVWTEADKIALIDSIFRHIDIGKIVLVSRDFADGDLKNYEVIDGKQRINALIEFFEDRFLFYGIKYSELNYKDKHLLDSYVIQQATLSGITVADKYKLFLKLNTTGKPQDGKHLEYVKSLYENEIKK